MPRLPSLRPKEITRILEKAGFVFKRTTGSHYIYYKKGIQRSVSVPFHTRSLPKGTQHAIFRQAQLKPEKVLRILRGSKQ